jgi:hypothetical protein
MKVTRYTGNGIDPGNCLGGHCEAFYRSDDGRYFVQGTVATRSLADSGAVVDVPSHEAVVEISPALVAAIKAL